MQTLMPVGKTPVNPDPIVRSLSEGLDYNPRWRSLLCEQYLIKIAQAPDESAALRDILSEEKDSFVRQLILFHWAGRSSKSRPIEYALRCYRSRHQNRMAMAISAMVVAGLTSTEIAQHLQTKRFCVVAYEKLFFDVRPYLRARIWIKDLCYSPGSATGLGDGASRWLITAFERGWDALAFTFSKPQSDPVSKCNPNPAGKRVVDRIHLGVFARLADFMSSLEMNGVIPNAEQVEPLLKMAFFARELSPTLSQLDYPTALSPKEEKKSREAAEMVGKVSPASRRKIITILERLQYSPETGQEGQNKPSGSP